MRRLLALGIIACATGCNPAAQEENDAARELAPKPVSESQQAQMDKIKSQFPGPGGAKPGR